MLAVFTDGMTDVGPSRRNLLGISGVADLFRECCAVNQRQATNAQTIMDRLIAGIEAYGNNDMHDDIALLVGVVVDRG